MASDRNGAVTTIAYSGIDNLPASMTDPDGRTTELPVIVAGGTATSSAPGGDHSPAVTREVDYDVFGRPTAVRGGGGEETKITYAPPSGANPGFASSVTSGNMTTSYLR